MYRTLLFLSKLRLYGGLRKLKRTLASPKGIVLALFMLAFIAMMVLPQLMVARMPSGARPPLNFNLFLHPAALFGLWISTSLGARVKSPISFSLPEVEFLFPGPFTRRQLLIYKLATSAVGGLGFAVIVPLVAWSYLEVWWPAAFLGLWWTVTFLQMATIFLTLVLDWFGERFRTWRIAAMAALVAVVLASLWHAGVLESDKDISDRLAALDSSWAAQTILAPFVVFNRFITATTLLQFATWGAAALAMNLVTVGCILQLNANFLEASLAASQRRYDWLQRVKRGGGVPSIGTRNKPRFSLPSFPRLLGAGPIAWRQSLQLMRGSGRLVFILPALVGPLIAVVVAARHDNQAPNAIGLFFPLFLTLFASFFITMIIPLGLRTDLQHVDAIKALPIGPSAIVWGSIASAIVYTTVIQLIVIVALAVATGQWTLGSSLALTFAVPVNLLLVASDSVLVVVFPSVRQFVPGDPFVGMRMMLVSLAKMLFVVVMTAIAGFYVFVIYVLVGEVRFAMGLAGWIILTIEGIITVWFAGLLLARYDPSSHAVDVE